MTVSTGNYDGEGVNRVSFPARTVAGETVMIEEKITRANQSTILVAEDGRTFEAAAGDGMNLVEVVLDKIEGMVEAVEDAADAAGEVIDSIQDALADGDDDEEGAESDGETAPEEAA